MATYTDAQENKMVKQVMKLNDLLQSLKAKNEALRESQKKHLETIERLTAENTLLKQQVDIKTDLVRIVDASARHWEKQANENQYRKDNYARLVEAAELCFVQLKDIESRTPELEHMYHLLRVTLIKTA